MKPVKIVSGEPEKNGCVLTRNTHVYVNDAELTGITGITIRYDVDDIVRATIDLIDVSPGTVHADASFQMMHPETGKRLTVKRIEFEDGSYWDG